MMNSRHNSNAANDALSSLAAGGGAGPGCLHPYCIIGLASRQSLACVRRQPPVIYSSSGKPKVPENGAWGEVGRTPPNHLTGPCSVSFGDARVGSEMRQYRNHRSGRKCRGYHPPLPPKTLNFSGWAVIGVSNRTSSRTEGGAAWA